MKVSLASRDLSRDLTDWPIRKRCDSKLQWRNSVEEKVVGSVKLEILLHLRVSTNFMFTGSEELYCINENDGSHDVSDDRNVNCFY